MPVRIDAVDFFYASMPTVTTAVDGSQDALLVRVRSGDDIGWGECEASPLVSIAAFMTPPSHGACQPVSASVLGRRLDKPEDILAISADVTYRSMDVLQASHTYSGIEMALWDLLGKRRDVPVWSLLGYDRSHGRIPYASILFGDTPDETYDRAREIRSQGFVAAKFGWGPFGHGTPNDDAAHLFAARNGLGNDTALMVDAGQVWRTDVDAVRARWDVLVDVDATWLEEPFTGSAFDAYAAISASTDPSRGPRLAAGESSHNPHMARHLIDYGKVAYIQIDTGRVGGIHPAYEVAQHADHRGVTYVNHTFTSHLALSAALQPYAGLRRHRWCEYPVALSPLAQAVTPDRLERDEDGLVSAPEKPGLGVTVDLDALAPYLHDIQITIDGHPVWTSGQ